MKLAFLLASLLCTVQTKAHPVFLLLHFHGFPHPRSPHALATPLLLSHLIACLAVLQL